MCEQNDCANALNAAGTVGCTYRRHQLRSDCSRSSRSAGHKISTTTNAITTNCLNHPFLRLVLLLISFALVGDHCWLNVHAAPQSSCVLCDANDLKADVKCVPSNSYEEFLFEHQVTRQDAINALRALNDSFYEAPSPQLSCKSVSCSKTVMKYCVSPQFINDHCWCELGHTDEGLPFIPHICYVGEKTYSPSVGSCFFYEEVKECCCAAALAKQWRHISKASSTTDSTQVFLALLLPLLVYLRRERF